MQLLLIVCSNWLKISTLKYVYGCVWILFYHEQQLWAHKGQGSGWSAWQFVYPCGWQCFHTRCLLLRPGSLEHNPPRWLHITRLLSKAEGSPGYWRPCLKKAKSQLCKWHTCELCTWEQKELKASLRSIANLKSALVTWESVSNKQNKSKSLRPTGWLTSVIPVLGISTGHWGRSIALGSRPVWLQNKFE